MSIFQAKHVTSHTLIGVGGDPPYSHGNCFSVAGEGGEYRILNFCLENIEALIELGLKWPIQCRQVSAHMAIIHDPRIGERWYSSRYCEVCCPESELPITQRQAHERQELRGQRKTHANSISFDLTIKAEFE
jgi:hypothetical protein